MLRLVITVSLALAAATGCHAARSPELRVLGIHDAPSSHVFVEVSNPARRPMKLTKLEYVQQDHHCGQDGQCQIVKQVMVHPHFVHPGQKLRYDRGRR